MNRRALWAIAKKDIRSTTSNVQIWLPLLVVPLVIGVILPIAIIVVIRTIGLASMNGGEMLVGLIEQLPGGNLKETLQSFAGLEQQAIYMLVNYIFVPFFLLIPVMVASVIGANSFVGEKERKTLESLLLAPIDIKELFVGKLLSAFLPAMAITFATFVLYGIAVNALAYPLFQSLIFPTWNWLVLLLWVVPIISFSVILLTVVISAKVKGYQEAYQLSGLIVVPLVALFIMQFTGLLLLHVSVLFIIGGVLLLAIILILPRVAKWNNRNALFESQVK
ncbi:ABC transporter permease subunit [Numidum massiliense]|uniref:ABC transporter permease subunit n=1 Tax=Numidum massiliense TaxID=1522315 RepID=UPI0006D57C85|nr:ABC transporter permease subunit [Numidum massiliense]